MPFYYYKISNNSIMQRILLIMLLLLLIVVKQYAQTVSSKLDFLQPDIMQAPTKSEEWQDFREKLYLWKKEARAGVKYDDSLYCDPSFRWASTAYNCYFLMMYDEAFFDHHNNVYKTDEFLDRLLLDYGHIDIIVLWHAYPRIGLDDRNQFDFYRDMPGGLDAIRDICDRLHSRGVKVFINYMPWDTGTCREDVSDIEMLTSLIKMIDADGIFLDTLPLGPAEFRAQLDTAKQGVVLESELSLPIEGIHNHHLSWGQWFSDSMVPGVLRNKWFETRHMQHAISRWTQNKMKDLQLAWMNGSGVMIWENIFGQYLEWSKRDKFMLKTMSSIQHKYADIFSTGEWFPLMGTIEGIGVYSSLWQKGKVRLWTLTNRTKEDRTGALVSVDIKKQERYFDLIKGIEIYPEIEDDKNGMLKGLIMAEGLGCFVAISEELVTDDFLSFLSTQSHLYMQRSNNTHSPILSTQQKKYQKTELYILPPKGMVSIPAVAKTMNATFQVREIGYYQSMDTSFIDAVYPRLHHFTNKSKYVLLNKYAIDEIPVTNSQFKAFIDDTGYSPTIKESFLRHWVNGEIPIGKENHPVVYVHLADARAYAKWAGKRLPTEEEWQFAAEGKENYKYPWGNVFDANKCSSSENGETNSVYQYPHGKSPFGCYDMCGNVWELTESEYTDGHTRFCILKGGSNHKAKGSDWYFIGGTQSTDFAAKQILIYPGIDRCATVGFRCVVDLE